MLVSERSKHYCQVPSLWTQYEELVLLFVSTSLLLGTCSRLALRGSADDHTRVGTIAMNEYVSMSSSMFVTNPRDRTSHSYYALNTRVDNLSGSILPHLLDNILDALKYFGLFKVAWRTTNDPVLTCTSFSRCEKVG